MKKILLAILLATTSLAIYATEEDGSGGTPATTNSTPVVKCYQVKGGEEGTGLKTVCVVRLKSDQEGTGGSQ